MKLRIYDSVFSVVNVEETASTCLLPGSYNTNHPTSYSSLRHGSRDKRRLGALFPSYCIKNKMAVCHFSCCMIHVLEIAGFFSSEQRKASVKGSHGERWLLKELFFLLSPEQDAITSHSNSACHRAVNDTVAARVCNVCSSRHVLCLTKRRYSICAVIDHKMYSPESMFPSHYFDNEKKT